MFSILQILLLLTPVLLLVSTLFAFQALPRRLGTVPGYLAGFLFTCAYLWFHDKQPCSSCRAWKLVEIGYTILSLQPLE